MYLYHGFCFGNAAEVVALRSSEGSRITDEGVVSVHAASVSGQVLTTTWRLTPAEGDSTDFVTTESVPTCPTMGPYPSSSGMTIADGALLGGLVAVAWVAAWAVSIVKRAL